MNACFSRDRIEAAVMGETPEAVLADVELHALGCARCRHELQWLRSEQMLFSQRAAREEVSRLWEGVVHKRDDRRPRRVTRALLALAASVFVAVTLGGRLVQRQHAHSRDEAPPMSLEMMSVDAQQQFASNELVSVPCYTPGGAFECD